MRGKTSPESPVHGNSHGRVLPVRGLYGSKEAREYLGGMSESTFRRKTASGEIEAKRLGNRVMCTREALDAFIARLPSAAEEPGTAA